MPGNWPGPHDGAMGKKKRKRKEEARIREGMAALLASAKGTGEAAPSGNSEPAATRLRGRGPQKAPTKQAVSIRLDRDVIEALKKDGRGWQTRANAILRDKLKLKP